jgi:hypothetical protein
LKNSSFFTKSACHKREGPYQNFGWITTHTAQVHTFKKRIRFEYSGTKEKGFLIVESSLIEDKPNPIQDHEEPSSNCSKQKLRNKTEQLPERSAKAWYERMNVL